MNLTKSITKASALIFLLLIIMLLAACFSCGFEISPATITVDYHPDSIAEATLNIINSEGADINLSLIPGGELKDLVFLENSTVQIKPNEYSTPINMKIKFPSTLAPGVQKASIKVTPNPQSSQSMFSVYVSYEIPVYIKVPYPSKYAAVSLLIVDVDEGTPLPVYVIFENMGSEDIANAGADIEIFNNKNKSIATLKTPEVSIKKTELYKAQAQPSPVLRKGFYKAIAKASYDGIDQTAEYDFAVGKPVIRIQELVTKSLTVGEINRIVFKAYNDWDSELTAAGAVQVQEKKNEVAGFSLDSGQEKEVNGFLDTTGLSPGKYNLSITLAYANQVRTEIFPVIISEKPVVLAEKPFYAQPLFIAILIMVLVLVIALLIVVFIKKRNKDRIKDGRA